MIRNHIEWLAIYEQFIDSDYFIKKIQTIFHDGFALICVEDENMVEKLKRSAFKDFTEKRIKNWEKATKFKKYGKSFCTDIDEKNLLFASSLKPSINGFLLVLFAFLINL